MFNGMFLDGMDNRWRYTRSSEDAAKARRMMEGLLLNSINDVKGYVSRGVDFDGRSHFATGSNDQTLPWCYGL